MGLLVLRGVEGYDANVSWRGSAGSHVVVRR